MRMGEVVDAAAITGADPEASITNAQSARAAQTRYSIPARELLGKPASKRFMIGIHSRLQMPVPMIRKMLLLSR